MIKVNSDDKYSYYSFKFYIYAGNINDEAVYKLYFHNCNGDELSYDLVSSSTHNYDFIGARYSIFPLAVWIIATCCFFILGLYLVYIYRTSQHALQNFHFLLAAIVFLLAFMNALITIRLLIIDLRGERRRNWKTFMAIFYLALFAIICGMLTLAVQGWNFVKSIFGRKERLCLMSVLIVQGFTWSIRYFEELYPISINHNEVFTLVILFDFLSVIVMVVYLFVRKAATRSHKAAENLRKFQLFRFVYIMIVICFYLITIGISILRFHFIVPVLKFFYQTYDEICIFVFFAVIGHKFQPKKLSEILALGNEGDVLPITDIKKELNDKDNQ
ncbi:unnamed protein product [Diamesa serratosioi]